jgi:hypothetical protein
MGDFKVGDKVVATNAYHVDAEGTVYQIGFTICRVWFPGDKYPQACFVNQVKRVVKSTD